MPESSHRRIETAAIVVGYAMSRLDQAYLQLMGLKTWKAAFKSASHSLDIPAASFKNLRDEFDPFHDNSRRGWHNRPLRPNRKRVMGDLCDLSDDALLQCVERILSEDAPATDELLTSLTETQPAVHNVAERLLTGSRAESLFLDNCEAWIGIRRADIIDQRIAALGFDFGVQGRTQQAIEVKGIKGRSGSILFTDREWAEAKLRQKDYWLVVVGNLNSTPIFRLWKNPYESLHTKCRYQRSITAMWTSRVQMLA